METLQRTANRGSVSTGYDIDNSLKLEDDNQEGLVRNYSGDGDRRTWTYSTWIKRTEIGNDYHYLVAANYNGIFFLSDNKLRIALYNGSTTYYANPERLFRDTSAWYHLVVALDTTQGTAADRVKVWVNGEAVTVWDQYTTYTNISQNDQMGFGLAAYNYQIAYYFAGGGTDRRFNGYMAETHMCNGVAADEQDFGEYDADSGIWIPKEYTGSHGTKGFYLKFDNASNLGEDTAGNGSFSLTNITSADQATDTPTNNFCTMNPLKGPLISFVNGTASNPRIPLMTEGATVLGNNANTYSYAEATMGVTSGKWYWEMKCTVDANTNVSGAGIATNINKGFYSTDGTGNFFWHMDGNRYVNGASTGYGAAWATNDILGFAYDADNWTLTCYKNNSSQGNVLASQADLSAEIVIPYMYSYGTHTYQWNFGGYHANSLSSAATDANGYGSFEYAPPSGYYALCTKNLAEYG